MTNKTKTSRTARWLSLALVGALVLAAAPSALARPHGPGPGPRHGPPPPAHHHHHHHHAGEFIAGAAIAGLTFGVIDAIARPCPPPPPPPPPPPAQTVVYTTPGSTVSYTTYSPAPVVYAHPLPPPPPPPPPRWRYGY